MDCTIGLEGLEGTPSRVLPLQKGGAQKVVAMLKEGHKRFLGRFNTGA